MLLSGTWDDGTTAAQLPVDVKKANEVPVFRDLLKKVPDLAGAVISADQMHAQRKHARAPGACGAGLKLWGICGDLGLPLGLACSRARSGWVPEARVTVEAVPGVVKRASRRVGGDDLPSWERKVVGPSVSVWLLACP
jgi:hypothetical protein